MLGATFLPGLEACAPCVSILSQNWVLGAYSTLPIGHAAWRFNPLPEAECPEQHISGGRYGDKTVFQSSPSGNAGSSSRYRRRMGFTEFQSSPEPQVLGAQFNRRIVQTGKFQSSRKLGAGNSGLLFVCLLEFSVSISPKLGAGSSQTVCILSL